MQDRFNWDNVSSKKPEVKKRLTEITDESRRDRKFKYVVDLGEKPQDPGRVNELCKERDHKAAELKAKTLRNPISVGNVARHTHLNSSI